MSLLPLVSVRDEMLWWRLQKACMIGIALRIQYGNAACLLCQYLVTSPNARLIDGIPLTKFDTIDDKVGAARSMVYVPGAPVTFVGCGGRQSHIHLKKLNINLDSKKRIQVSWHSSIDTWPWKRGCQGSSLSIEIDYDEEIVVVLKKPVDPETQQEAGMISLYRKTHFIDKKVLGVRPSYKWGLGHGKAPPSRKRVAGYEHPDMDQLRARAEEAESQLEELRGWKEAAQETQATHQAQIQQQQRQLDYLMEKLGGPPSMCTMPTEVKSLSVESSSNEDEPVYMNLDDPIEASSRSAAASIQAKTAKHLYLYFFGKSSCETAEKEKGNIGCVWLSCVSLPFLFFLFSWVGQEIGIYSWVSSAVCPLSVRLRWLAALSSWKPAHYQLLFSYGKESLASLNSFTPAAAAAAAAVARH
ncbi:hypothetical protein IFM89_010382 [Coptis chinensis]|uniref:Uncharacterized protein n=1 Tax=Coptis chinensis TaxID=261450 RepID=A0A835MHX4_9MAGN|nr:hypothetical protein IFM89_010382 [Coptis chinensis]